MDYEKLIERLNGLYTALREEGKQGVQQGSGRAGADEENYEREWNHGYPVKISRWPSRVEYSKTIGQKEDKP